MPDTWQSNPRRRNGTFLCEDSEKRSLNGILGPKHQSLQKNQQILLQGLSEVSECSDGMRNIG